ncbi:sensor histidine kinase [Sphingomonas sp. M1-B02]|uniref:sensor histidine kinase n=1 Tax=Sphingomonas sp. M1-B02 TaxID=3114300 RepID=UPI00223F6B09|nr:sensor histidine kinase [Sphingomonas sp. S6-11]UZK66996.1 sensor histidine kinase [Sphingomonas sp. S6-11]
MTITQHAAFEVAAVTVLPALREPSSMDEANHRVANSLQLTAALVSIAARRITDPAALAVLDTTTRRIAAIAGVHRQLYRQRSVGGVDLGGYLEDLGADLETSCGDADAGRHVRVAADRVVVTPEVATSIGVIVSELVGNACKYAYPSGHPGDVEVSLRDAPRGGFVLEVADQGRGRIAGAAPEGSGLGTELVAMMARRLGAQHRWHDARPGTRFTLCV